MGDEPSRRAIATLVTKPFVTKLLAGFPFSLSNEVILEMTGDAPIGAPQDETGSQKSTAVDNVAGFVREVACALLLAYG